MITTTENPDAGRWRRDLLVYALLMLCMVAVHFMITGKLKSPAQEAVFAWSGIAAIGVAGLIGVVLARLAKLHGLWDPGLGLARKLWQPLFYGLAFGAVTVVIDQMTGATAAMAAKMHMESIHIDFPLSVPIYFGASVMVTILYFSVLIPLFTWLISGLLLKGRHQSAVFWSVGALCMLIEPLTQGELQSALTSGDAGAIAYMVPGLFLEFGQVLFLRRAGMVASVISRIGYYTFSHVVAGLLAGAY